MSYISMFKTWTHLNRSCWQTIHQSDLSFLAWVKSIWTNKANKLHLPVRKESRNLGIPQINVSDKKIVHMVSSSTKVLFILFHFISFSNNITALTELWWRRVYLPGVWCVKHITHISQLVMSSGVNVKTYVTHGLKWEVTQKWLWIPCQVVQNVTLYPIIQLGLEFGCVGTVVASLGDYSL